MTDQPRNNLPYLDAIHGVQAGVGYELFRNDGDDSRAHKHLRTGVNSAMCDHTALVRLLIAKGIITPEEYAEEVRLEANRELDRYEDRAGVQFR